MSEENYAAIVPAIQTALGYCPFPWQTGRAASEAAARSDARGKSGHPPRATGVKKVRANGPPQQCERCEQRRRGRKRHRIPSGIVRRETAGVKRLNPYRVQGRARFVRECRSRSRAIAIPDRLLPVLDDRIPLTRPPHSRKPHEKWGFLLCKGHCHYDDYVLRCSHTSGIGEINLGVENLI